MTRPSGDASTFTDTVEESKRIEWPAGSGVFADYSPEERFAVRGLFRMRDEEEILDEQLRREVGHLHDLKAFAGARLVGDGDPEQDAEQIELVLPDPDSPFQIPPRALRRLVGVEG